MCDYGGGSVSAFVVFRPRFWSISVVFAYIIFDGVITSFGSASPLKVC